MVTALHDRTVEQLRKTPLRLACEAVSLDLVRLLLERGADPNIRGQFGTLFNRSLLSNLSRIGGLYGSPLHVAVQKNSIQIVKLLLENGADPSIRGEYKCMLYPLRIVPISTLQTRDIEQSRTTNFPLSFANSWKERQSSSSPVTAQGGFGALRGYVLHPKSTRRKFLVMLVSDHNQGKDEGE
ncbi:hypothetical protein NMY22_g9423 [Coprinellus aureogranulatus]|nr:hypothetical protein NMY22_g9423 [Coprinellus aureogranulatus]